MKFELYKIFCRKTTVALFAIIFIVIFVTVLLNLDPEQRSWRAAFVPYMQAEAVYVIGTTGSVFHPDGGSIFALGGRFLPFYADVDSPLIQRILAMYEQVEISPYLYENPVWQSMRRFLSASMFFVGMIIILGVAPVFAEERSTGVDKIILTAKKGKSKVVFYKILAALIFTTVVYTVFVAAIIIPHVMAYDTSGWHYPINVISFLDNSPYNLTIASLFVRNMGVGLLSSLLLCMMGLVISALSRNPFIAVIPSLLLFILSPFRAAEISVGVHRFMTLFPANTMWSTELWNTPDFYNIFGLLIDRPTMAVLFSLIGICVLIALCFFITKRMEPSN